MSNIKDYTSLLNTPKFYPSFVLLGANIVLLVIAIFISVKAYDQYVYSSQIQTDIDKTKSDINLIRNNQSLLSERIDEYNKLLEKLIPDEETYFSVISALDLLESRTGVTIASYTINLQSTTEEKLALQVSVVGEKEAVDKFLDEYMYVGGRLLTSESIIIGGDVETTYSFILNFYHKPYADGGTTARKITQKDLDYLDEVKSKL